MNALCYGTVNKPLQFLDVQAIACPDDIYLNDCLQRSDQINEGETKFSVKLCLYDFHAKIFSHFSATVVKNKVRTK